jgi:hypothetical protein
MNTNNLIIDERLESVLTTLSESQILGLKESIKAIGCTDPILVWNDVIVDGVMRYTICKELGVEFDIRKVEFTNMAEAAKWRIERHRNRRQMNITNQIEAFLELFESELAEQAKANQIEGARKGGMAKGGIKETDLNDNKVWVNPLIAQLANTNPTYVSCIRNLRKKAENNNFKAKAMLFKLRRGEMSISSAMKSEKSETKDATKKKKSSETNTKNVQTSLLEDFDKDKWGNKIALEQMKYEKLKDHFSDIEQQENIIDPNIVSAKVSKYCGEENLYGLVATLVPLLEISYRIGFIKGSMEQSEDGVRAEFSNREEQLQSRLRQWMQFQDEENQVKDNAEEQNDSVE